MIGPLWLLGHGLDWWPLNPVVQDSTLRFIDIQYIFFDDDDEMNYLVPIWRPYLKD